MFIKSLSGQLAHQTLCAVFVGAVGVSVHIWEPREFVI